MGTEERAERVLGETRCCLRGTLPAWCDELPCDSCLVCCDDECPFGRLVEREAAERLVPAPPGAMLVGLLPGELDCCCEAW